MIFPNKIKIIKADITTLGTEVIVNAANKELAGGGGVDEALHKAAGPGMMAELRARYMGCPVGEARKTRGYYLRSKFVYHAVGPIWRGGNNDEDELLSNVYSYCFDLAFLDSIKSIAFPAISCGVYNFPLSRAAALVREITEKKLQEYQMLEEVIFCLFNKKALKAYQKAFK